ncbi:alpha/beta hydrolase [Synechococcus sp. RedBA-s]|nr:alpha/beta hydrolase [Synechococcus sp. RedBA-s]
MQAAERVVFRIGELQRSVPVADLASFVSTGKVSENVAFILDPLSKEDRLALRFGLGRAFPVTSLEVSDFLQTAMGGVLVRQFAKLVDGPKNEVVPALSGALILGANRSDGLRLIDVLQQYPLENLIIGVPKVMNLARRLSDQFELEGDIFPRLVAQGPKSQIPSTALDQLAQPGNSSFSREGFSFQGPAGNTIKAIALVPSSANPPAGSASAPPAPLIVLAPGLNTDFNALLYLGEHLASRGYGVAALNFPDTSANRVSATIQGLAAIPPPNAWFNQPLDVSLLIDQVASRWPKQIDTSRVGALGQSLGGYTVLALGGARLDWAHLERSCAVINDPAEVEINPAILWQCQAPGNVVKRSDFSDPRIKVVIAVNPVSTPTFTKASMQAMKAPVMIVSGTKDIFAPPISQQLIPYSSLSNNDSLLAVFDNATHLSFLAATGKLPVWLIGLIGPDQQQAQSDLKALSLAFFDQKLLGQGTMGALLPSQDALFRVGQPLQFLLKRELPPAQLKAIDP